MHAFSCFRWDQASCGSGYRSQQKQVPIDRSVACLQATTATGGWVITGMHVVFHLALRSQTTRVSAARAQGPSHIEHHIHLGLARQLPALQCSWVPHRPYSCLLSSGQTAVWVTRNTWARHSAMMHAAESNCNVQPKHNKHQPSQQPVLQARLISLRQAGCERSLFNLLLWPLIGQQHPTSNPTVVQGTCCQGLSTGKQVSGSTLCWPPDATPGRGRWGVHSLSP